MRIQESGEKRERTRRKSSLSLFLSLYLDCLAGFPRPRIDNTRPSPRRSFLSLDLFSTLATLVHDHSPRRFFPSNKRLTRVLSQSSLSSSSLLSSSLLLFVVLSFFPPHYTTGTKEFAKSCVRSCCATFDGRVPRNVIDAIDASSRR